MPTYVYACTECGHQFEAHQSFSDASLTECPNCSGRLRKVFNSVGIVFKGSGFYRNDSREKAGAASDSSGADKGGDKATEKSGDKVAAKSESGSAGSSGSSDSSSGSSSSGSSGSSGASSSSGSSSSNGSSKSATTSSSSSGSGSAA